MKRYKKIIQKYLKGKSSPAESRIVDLWFDSISSDEIDPFTNERDRERLGNEIFNKIEQKIFTRKVFFRKYDHLLIAAATLVFVISTVIILSIQNSKVPPTLTLLTTQIGEIKKVLLPDSSEVWLDGNAQITYSVRGFHKERSITVDRGRIYFDVKKDKSHPFSVRVGALEIQVLGTSFDVVHDVSSADVRVQVSSGIVRVFNDAGSIDHILKKGKSLNYAASTHEIQLQDADANTISVWKEGGLFLQKVNFEELRQILYNRYGIHLTAQRVVIENLEFSILIPKVQSIDQILEVISNIHKLKYRRMNNEVIIY